MCNSFSDPLNCRLPCPSPSPGFCSNSCPLSWWCHPTISPSVIPFSSCLQSFPASESFPMSWLLASGGQSIGVSASVLLNEYQGWFPLGNLPWLSAFQIWPLELREGQGSWSLAYKKWGMKRDVCDQVKLSFLISNETLGSNLISQFLSFLFFF